MFHAGIWYQGSKLLLPAVVSCRVYSRLSVPRTEINSLPLELTSMTGVDDSTPPRPYQASHCDQPTPAKPMR
jgi:hypothetical protein